MKKYLPYLILLLALGAAVGYFVYQYAPSTLDQRESDFAVKDISSVTRVLLVNEAGLKIDLTKNGKNFIVNGKYEINEEARDQLLMVIQKVASKYVAPYKAQPNILKELSIARIRCEIYQNKNPNPAKVYLVGGPTADGEGTYMIQEIDGAMARQAYITHLPGLSGYLTLRYTPTEPEHWRTKWVYRDNDQSIKSLRVEYNREHQKGFTINRVAPDSFTIADADGKIDAQPKQKYIHQYLEFYAGLSIENYANDDKAKDTITKESPFCTITLTRNDGRVIQSILYYMPINAQSHVRVDEQGRALSYDIERYYALLNGKEDFVTLQYYVWSRALRTYQEFYAKPSK